MKTKKLFCNSLVKRAAVMLLLLSATTLVAQPDLVPGINYSYNPPGANGIITNIVVDACNNNATAAGPFDVSMYLYDQSTSNYWIIGTIRATSGLSGNACVTSNSWNIDINDTPGIPQGTYRLGIWVDSDEEISETDENNNAGLLSGNINYTPSTTNIQENNKSLSQLNIYPNPVKDILNISFNMKETDYVNVELIDINGRLISIVNNNLMTSGNQEINYATSDLENGIYFVKIYSEKFSIMQKVVVLH